MHGLEVLVVLYKIPAFISRRRLVIKLLIRSEKPPSFSGSRFLEIYYCSTAMIKKPMAAARRWQWIF